MIDHAHELRRKLGSDDLIDHVDIHAYVKPLLAELLDRLEAAEKEIESWKGLAQQFGNEADALRAKVAEMEKRLRLILEEPENTMSNSKAMREMVRQARLALEKSK